jgi:CO/xanthine dehydrogenase FAD-binding subunit
MMNFRLARPAHLIDLNGIGELGYLRADGDGLRIGAMARQRALERAPEIAAGWPLLVEAAYYIAHPQIRNRGTVGGSLAHADPAAELPAAMAVLDATYVIRGPAGEREASSDEFFLGYLMTALGPDELLVEIRVPPLPPRTGWAFQEVSRRHGDFALVGVAALVTLDAQGRIAEARLATTGAGPTPARLTAAETLLAGQIPDEALFREAGARASAALDPDTDLHASADYRREVGGVLVRRALVQAAARASNDGARHGRMQRQ